MMVTAITTLQVAIDMTSAYHCQRCRLPLTLHESIVDINPAQLGLLLNDSNNTAEDWHGRRTIYGAQLAPDPLTESYRDLGYMTKDSKSAESAQNPGDSFIVLTRSLIRQEQKQDLERGNGGRQALSSSPTIHANTLNSDRSEKLSPFANVPENLFEVLSSKGVIDYPICKDCADVIKEELEPKYEESCKERDTYISFLNKIKDQPVSGSEELEDLLNEISKLEEESVTALEELKIAEKEQFEAQNDYDKVKKEGKFLIEEERRFNEEQNKLTVELENSLREKDRVDSLVSYYTNQLQRLQKINVYNDLFCIGHDGYFGTINGLRLGRLKEKKVEWPEINAAWGQTLLLLATVIHRLNYKLVGYRLRPLGSMSRIERYEVDAKTGQPSKPVVLELYSSGDYSFERILNHKRLDAAMVAFLQILRQVGEFVEKCDPNLKLPYVIDKDKIGGYSIKLSLSSSNESWTIACKYVLTNAKWILAYASSQ